MVAEMKGPVVDEVLVRVQITWIGEPPKNRHRDSVQLGAESDLSFLGNLLVGQKRGKRVITAIEMVSDGK